MTCGDVLEPCNSSSRRNIRVAHCIAYLGVNERARICMEMTCGGVLEPCNCLRWVQKRLIKLYVDCCKELSETPNIKLLKKLYNLVVKFEGSNGGTWVSVTERSRGLVVSVGFGREEVDWLTEHLKKAVELENTRGFTRKFRGVNKIHLMEICFNNRGRFMKITKIATRRKPLLIVIPEGVKEVVAEDGIRSGVPLSAGKWARAVICECKEKVQDWIHEGKAIARMMGVKGMVSINPISAFKGCFFVSTAGRAKWFQEQESLLVKGRLVLLRRWTPRENMIILGKFRRGWLVLKGLPFHLWEEDQLKFILKKWGRVTEVAREAVKLLDLSKVKLWVEMHPNVVLPALLEVEDGAWKHTIAFSVIGEEGEDDTVTSEISHRRYEWLKEGVASLRRQNLQRGYEVVSGVMSATVGSFFPGHVIGAQVQAWRPKGRKDGKEADWA
ncbi:hypothetical protein CK203_020180 [Vitis vinifera]|uniref:Uncharacterized protein n=1 Tax=Vitis vinifera TaxID=29760 RepID=A0A438J7Z9_VITVI|nr:hypothetical protein CK203_020180 [Vitis vinifera]